MPGRRRGAALKSYQFGIYIYFDEVEGKENINNPCGLLPQSPQGHLHGQKKPYLTLSSIYLQ